MNHAVRYESRGALSFTRCATKHAVRYETRGALRFARCATSHAVRYESRGALRTRGALRLTRRAMFHAVRYVSRSALRITRCATNHAVRYVSRGALCFTRCATFHAVRCVGCALAEDMPLGHIPPPPHCGVGCVRECAPAEDIPGHIPPPPHCGVGCVRVCAGISLPHMGPNGLLGCGGLACRAGAPSAMGPLLSSRGAEDPACGVIPACSPILVWRGMPGAERRP